MTRSITAWVRMRGESPRQLERAHAGHGRTPTLGCSICMRTGRAGQAGGAAR